MVFALVFGCIHSEGLTYFVLWENVSYVLIEYITRSILVHVPKPDVGIIYRYPASAQ
jgi:hypothetical protein